MHGHRELIEAVEWATRAPSIHNTQPWRWVIEDDVVELYADWSTHLVATDPDRRDLALSCGGALHHLAVALAARDQSVHIERYPDPDDQTHLATVTVRSGSGDAIDAGLFSAIPRRRTDRRRMSFLPVTPEFIRTLVDHAQRHGVVAMPLADPAVQERVTRAIREAAQTQTQTPGYAAELYIWTHRYAGASDGIPRANIPHSLGMSPGSPLRAIPPGLLHESSRVGGGVDDAAELLVLATPADEPVDRLRAGEAMSAVLLSATDLGLATTPLSQALEVPDARQALSREIRGAAEPQLIIRVGWPADPTTEIPPTPRRSVESVRWRRAKR